MDTKTKNLIRLLDDDSEQFASMVMAELLSHDGSHLEKLLRRMQETPNPRMRRRIHQLQSIMILRRRRRNLAQNLEHMDLGLLDGLVEMHLLWYDNDLPESVYKQWEALVEESMTYRPSTLERLSYFMRKKGFACPAKDDIEADYFCLGTILEEYVGADFALCVIAKLLAAFWDLKLKMTQLAGDFVLIDEKGQALHPANDWKIIQNIKKANYKEWDSNMSLRLIGSMLFICAISTDSFRYAYTIGSCLSRSCGSEGLDFLPYPYNTSAASDVIKAQ